MDSSKWSYKKQKARNQTCPVAGIGADMPWQWHAHQGRSTSAKQAPATSPTYPVSATATLYSFILSLLIELSMYPCNLDSSHRTLCCE